MCFDYESLPPIPVIAGAAVSHTDLELESADGTVFAAFAALPDEPGPVGVVILPDVRGLYRFYEELALRFAERGFAAVAIDYFGRTAGVSKRDDHFEYMEHVAQTTPANIQADTGAAIAWLRSPAGGSCRSIFTVGFCFGGRNSWLAAASHELSGRSASTGALASGTDSLGRLTWPRNSGRQILALQAGADVRHITAEDNAAFDQALTAAGVSKHEARDLRGRTA